MPLFSLRRASPITSAGDPRGGGRVGGQGREEGVRRRAQGVNACRVNQNYTITRPPNPRGLRRDAAERNGVTLLPSPDPREQPGTTLFFCHFQRIFTRRSLLGCSVLRMCMVRNQTCMHFMEHRAGLANVTSIDESEGRYLEYFCEI